MNITIILAAGNSERMRGVDKIFYPIKKRPLIFYTISAFEKHSQIKKIIIVARRPDFKKIFSLTKKYKFQKIAMVREGGKERQDSAFNGLKAAGDLGAKSGDLILFHNGCNPLVSKKEITDVIRAAKRYKAALVGQLAKDTVKKINKNKFVLKTIDRKNIFLAQTPQVIEYGLAKMAFGKAFQENFYGTDDVSLVERLGKKVKTVQGSFKNIKVTYPEDLKFVESQVDEAKASSLSSLPSESRFMKIVFAKNIGFCSGVKRAIDIAKISFKKDKKPIQFLGNLVHNEKVIENLKRKGGKIISDLDQVKSGTLIIKAHGVSPALETKIAKSVLIRDATCPLVKKAQLAAGSLFEDGYQVIIIGDRNHPETEGIKGYTKNQAVIVENKSQAKKLKKFKKIGVITQTTQNLDKVNQILKILKQKARKFKWLNTICPEVLVRQKELSGILKKADGVLVIGSRGSANTKRLVQICRDSKKPVWWINALEDLKKQKLTNISILGVVSGTSTPDWEIKKIKKIKKYLKNLK